MAGTEGDIIQVVLSGTVISQTMQNVHFYRVEDTPTEGYLTGILIEFEDEVLPFYAACAVTAVSYLQLYAKNIFSGDEAFLSPLSPATGSDAGGSASPSFVAASLKLIRQNARVRHGRKSVAGSSENDFVAQQWVSGYMTKLNALGAVLAETLSAGLTDNFAPVIVGRVEYAPDPEAPLVKAHRLPVSQGEMSDKWSYFTSVLASPNVSTMNSRKIGHGI